MSVVTVTGTTSAAIATAGTLAVSYPTGYTRGDFVLGARHRLSVIGKVFKSPENMTVSLGATSATITYQGTTTIPAGSRFTLELDRNADQNSLKSALLGGDTFINPGIDTFVFPVKDYAISFGGPTTLSTTAICTATAVAGAGAIVITTGTKYASATANVPLGAPTGRAVQIVSSSASDTTTTVIVRGKDMYGQNMSQTLTINGTTPVLGTRAFFSVTSVTVSAAMVGTISVGDTDVLGMPVWLGATTFVWRETQDNALATSGTLVAGLGQTLATTTNGDVRGTYTPNAATNGSRSCVLFAVIPEPNFYGQAQFTS